MSREIQRTNEQAAILEFSRLVALQYWNRMELSGQRYSNRPNAPNIEFDLQVKEARCKS